MRVDSRKTFETDFFLIIHFFWQPLSHSHVFLTCINLFEGQGKLAKKVAGRPAAASGVSRKGGGVWHTQGVGKSIKMVCAASVLLVEPEIRNPTKIIVTDRSDLDGQLFATFLLN